MLIQPGMNQKEKEDYGVRTSPQQQIWTTSW